MRTAAADIGRARNSSSSFKGRPCGGCGLPLSRYNQSSICQSCISKSRKRPGSSPAGVSVNGKAIQELRHKHGLTRVLLADRAGLSASVIKGLERGSRKSAKISTLTAIAGALQASVDELLESELISTAGPAHAPRAALTREDIYKVMDACRGEDPREDGIYQALIWVSGIVPCSADTFIERQLRTARAGPPQR